MRSSLCPPPPRAGAGFSLIEVLIAAVLMLAIAVGILPLFTRAMTASLAGNDSSQASNHGRSRLEELYQLPFNSPGLAITAGSEATATAWWSDSDRTWRTGAPAATAAWSRSTRVRQFSLAGLVDDDGDGEFDEPLAAGTDPAFVHVKEIVVRLESNRTAGSPLGVGRPITLRILKPH